MNVANLQIEGLKMALAYTHHALVRKGVLSVDNVDQALRKAESGLRGGERLFEDMSPANRDAVCFPIRVLQAANLSADERHTLDLSELAKLVGLNRSGFARGLLV